MTDKNKQDEILNAIKEKVSSECSKYAYSFVEKNDRLVGRSEGEQKFILEGDFDTVFLHNGDEELISSCNTEYNFDDKDCVATNGAMNLTIMLMERDKREGFLGDDAEFNYVTCVRGSGYVIIAEPSSGVDGSTKYLLYANKNTIADDYGEILRMLNMMKSYYPLIGDYIKKNGIHIVMDGSYARGYE